MSRPLRFWLFFPLVVLTLFFAVCGWRSWHLADDERGAWREGIAFTVSRLPSKSRVTGSDLSKESEQRQIARLMAVNYPQATASIVPFGTAFHPTWIEASDPNILNRYRATVAVTCSDTPEGGYGQTTVTVILGRSPLKFWDNTWHAVGVEK